jgi:hypothetical protein
MHKLAIRLQFCNTFTVDNFQASLNNRANASSCQSPKYVCTHRGVAVSQMPKGKLCCNWFRNLFYYGVKFAVDFIRRNYVQRTNGSAPMCIKVEVFFVWHFIYKILVSNRVRVQDGSKLCEQEFKIVGRSLYIFYSTGSGFNKGAWLIIHTYVLFPGLAPAPPPPNLGQLTSISHRTGLPDGFIFITKIPILVYLGGPL